MESTRVLTGFGISDYFSILSSSREQPDQKARYSSASWSAIHDGLSVIFQTAARETTDRRSVALLTTAATDTAIRSAKEEEEEEEK